ncbi:MAG TPA: ABC transporter ATP-binding protein [Acidimicrobiia bacterium]|nr:ABC transporter ATP-binding protein [Acidimicrobiia bacterium]
MPEPAISIEGVSKVYRLYDERNDSLKATVMRGRRARYQEFWALTDVSLEIPAGETFGIVGENGSGKSTLLKCIARILYPERGRIVSRGKVSALLELAAGFHQELSGRENLYLNGSILGLSKRQIDARFDDIVGFAGIEPFIDAPVKTYSSGMYVRLGFSIAINVEPDILLIDEVLAVGDAEFQQRCLEKFAELRQSGRTVVIVSHQMAALRNVCAHAALLEHGQLRAVGPATEVIDLYRDEAHSDRVADGEHGVRWGSGEVRVEAVEIIGADGEPTRTVRTGDPITLRFRYRSQEPVERPVFGFWIQRFDGAYVTAPNLRDADLVPEKVDGEGWVDYRVDRLLLLPGAYDLSAAVYDYTLNHPYDHRERTLRFDVEFGEPHEERGLVSFGGEWSMGEGPP